MKKGGLYRNIKMSVRTADLLVLITGAIFVLCFVFAVNHKGFSVTFDSNGGSDVSCIEVMYGETVTASVCPEREKYVFTGWYTDKNCTVRWDENNSTATESITLYAGWEPLY